MEPDDFTDDTDDTDTDTDTDDTPDWFAEALGELREAYGTGAWEADPATDNLIGVAGGHLIRVEREERDDGWFRAALLGAGPDTEGIAPRSAVGAVRTLLARLPKPAGRPELRVVEGGRR